MKRHPGLITLAREHHAALLLARQARRVGAAAAADAGGQAVAVARTFAAELGPHFQVEEEGLLPALAAAGEDVLVARTLAEHATLRALAERLAGGDASTLCEFGAVLAAHIRFEDRELFPRAEAILPSDMLASIDMR
ncbi:MAG: hemerythrin domain-containing protein [Gammaproteobacteria bacterium]|nr:hemerythrin domain-containing protein [Gammaproteobacteria bacterium]